MIPKLIFQVRQTSLRSIHPRLVSLYSSWLSTMRYAHRLSWQLPQRCEVMSSYLILWNLHQHTLAQFILINKVKIAKIFWCVSRTKFLLSDYLKNRQKNKMKLIVFNDDAPLGLSWNYSQHNFRIHFNITPAVISGWKVTHFNDVDVELVISEAEVEDTPATLPTGDDILPNGAVCVTAIGQWMAIVIIGVVTILMG